MLSQVLQDEPPIRGCATPGIANLVAHTDCVRAMGRSTSNASLYDFTQLAGRPTGAVLRLTNLPKLRRAAVVRPSGRPFAVGGVSFGVLAGIDHDAV